MVAIWGRKVGFNIKCTSVHQIDKMLPMKERGWQVYYPTPTHALIKLD